MALRQANGTIDVYAHGEHNHLIEPEGTRVIFFCEQLIMSFLNT
jgi:hypothetical protein